MEQSLPTQSLIIFDQDMRSVNTQLKCSNKNDISFLCRSSQCRKQSFMCMQKDCQCQLNHKYCGGMIWKENYYQHCKIISNCQPVDKKKQLTQRIENWYNNNIDKIYEAKEALLKWVNIIGWDKSLFISMNKSKDSDCMLLSYQVDCIMNAKKQKIQEQCKSALQKFQQSWGIISNHMQNLFQRIINLSNLKESIKHCLLCDALLKQGQLIVNHCQKCYKKLQNKLQSNPSNNSKPNSKDKNFRSNAFQRTEPFRPGNERKASNDPQLKKTPQKKL